MKAFYINRCYSYIPLLKPGAMGQLFINRVSKRNQLLFSIVLVLFVSGICFLFSSYINYRVVAFILLVTVSLIAMSLDIVPVFVSALLSAVIWDFFFIPPRFTLHVTSTEDSILLVMYFVISLVNGVLTYKIRSIEKVASQKESRENTIKLYNTFLNSLSHELRTPIASIIGATDNLQHNDGRLSDKNRSELLTEISSASIRLNQQVENLLSMSRLESGFITPRKDWCDINEVVYGAIKRVEENIPSQKISVHVDNEISLIKSDKVMLEQIVYNLLNNAIQYTGPNCEIAISADCENNLLKLTIEDNGPGIPPQDLDKVFDKFYRVSHARTGGTGLGLSIVKGFTEALEGNIVLRNLDTGGAKFIVEIPVETSQLHTLKND